MACSELYQLAMLALANTNELNYTDQGYHKGTSVVTFSLMHSLFYLISAAITQGLKSTLNFDL